MKTFTFSLPFRYFLRILVVLAVPEACSPDQDYFRTLDNTRLRYVLADNPQVSSFAAAAEMTEMGAAFGGERSYVVLAPANPAFLVRELNAETIRSMGSAWLSRTINSHVLEDYLDLHALPWFQKQRLFTRQGQAVYVTKWRQGQDTVFTFNGVRAASPVLEASNGKVYVLPNLLQDRVYRHVLESLQDRHEMSLFSYAVSYAGMEEELMTRPECTLFVPDNQAMTAFGYGSFEAIQAAGKEVLQQMIRYHMLDRLLFVNDIALSVDMSPGPRDYNDQYTIDVLYPDGTLGYGSTPDTQRGMTQMQMANQQSLQMIFTEGYYHGLYGSRFHLQDRSTAQAVVNLVDRDWVSGNGIIHRINKVLEF